MCHIDSNSAVYSLLQSECDNEGLVALQYVQEDHVGNLPLTPSEVSKLNSEWLQLDFHKVELNRLTILKYAEKIQLLAEGFPVAKTNQEKYDKFLDGLPSQLQNRVLLTKGLPRMLRLTTQPTILLMLTIHRLATLIRTLVRRTY